MRQSTTYKRAVPGIIALSLMLVVLFCYAGGLIVWDVAHKITYEYVRSHRNELKFRDTVIVSAQALKGGEELSWVKHDEIRFHGRMYDIKQQIVLTDGRIMLVGHYDDWDDKLFKSLEQMLEPSPGQHPQKEKQSYYWIADAVITALQQQGHYYYPEFAQTHFPKDDQFFKCRYRPDVPVPPPDACII